MGDMGDERIGTLVIGVTGSVGVLAMPLYARLFRETLARDVFVMMSRAAQKFVTPYSFELHTGHSVFCEIDDRDEEIRVPHVELARRADLLLVAPATANVIARCAHGLCEDLISTTVVACRAPVVFVPSMNGVMWESRVVQRNVAMLRELGHHVVEPARGIEIVDLQPSSGAMPTFGELLPILQKILADRAGAEPR